MAKPFGYFMVQLLVYLSYVIYTLKDFTERVMTHNNGKKYT